MAVHGIPKEIMFTCALNTLYQVNIVSHITLKILEISKFLIYVSFHSLIS